MTGVQLLIVVFCGIVIGLAVYLLVRSLRKMMNGKCCEGCAACPLVDQCQVRRDEVKRKDER